MRTYIVSGVVCNLDRVRSVAHLQPEHVTNRAVAGAVVTAEVLADTARQYPECRCEELGLAPGFPIAELILLEEGCTEKVMKPRRAWICPRLNTIRGIYRPWAARSRDRSRNQATIENEFHNEPVEVSE